MGDDRPTPQEIRAAYVGALRARTFTTEDRPHVAMAVSTLDLDAGRGDVYVAVGLGLELARLGYEVVYLDVDAWHDPPPRTDIYVALVSEARAAVEPLLLPPGMRRIAWVRNNTRRWASSRHLGMYDAVLCSSHLSLQEVRRHYGGPSDILRIGVDGRLFTPGAPTPRTKVVTTVNQWGPTRGVYAALAATTIDFDLDIHGVQLDLPRGLQRHARGPVSFFDLPDVYRQAALVLDDQQDVNRGFGNVNSRLYEALACGSLPITNVALGLRAVGLDDVPVYRDGADLRATTARLLQDPAQRELLTSRLREVVLRDHTYEVRAQEFDRFVRANGLRDGSAPPLPTIAFFPDYRVTNPYQSMLYSRASAAGIVTVPTSRVDELAQVFAHRGASTVAHVHWTAPVLGPAVDEEDARRRGGQFIDVLEVAQRRGARLVWTVHNVLPHETRYEAAEVELRQALADRADVVHVMCDLTHEVVRDRYTLPRDRTVVIPHSSYVGMYPDVVDTPTARGYLGLDDDALVFLFLGQVRPYKGLEELLDAFAVVHAQRPDARLIIAGAPGKDPALVGLVARCHEQPGVLAHLEPIADEDLQLYLRAADIAVLPYRRALNSGALQLALTAGCPVVVPATGCLAASVPPGAGIVYAPDADLAAVLVEAAEQLTTEQARQVAFAAAVASTPVQMSEALVTLVLDLLRPPITADP